MNDTKIKTYPKMNEHIKFSLSCSDDQFDEYTLVRIEELEKENERLKAFYDYWAELHGEGLGVSNWHMNGELEDFDNFFDSAEGLLTD